MNQTFLPRLLMHPCFNGNLEKKKMKTVPEHNAELLSAEDVHGDVASLSALLERRCTERRAYDILNRPNIREMLKQLIATGICMSEEEAIERALKTLLTAVTP